MTVRTLALVLFLCLASLAPAMAIDVILDGSTVPLDQPAIMEGGRVMVPLRGVFEKMGATVRYDASTRTIRAEREGGNVVELTLDSNVAAVNSKPVELDVPAHSVYGRTVVPLRFVSEAMGATVVWEASSQTVSITTTPPSQTYTAPSTGPRIYSVDIVEDDIEGGNDVHIHMNGTPAGEATVEIGDRDKQPMREVEPGRYEAVVATQPDWDVSDALVTATIANDGQTVRMRAAHTLRVRPHLVAPVIRSLSHNGAALVPGQALEVRLRGTPGGQASFDVPGVQNDVAMREVAEGEYIGTLSPPPTVRGLALIARLSLGGQSTQMQAAERVSVTDTFALTVSYPRAAQQVPGSFLVVGSTLPEARVEIRIVMRRTVMPGDVVRATFNGQADASGYFRVPVSITSAYPGSTLRLVVSAIDDASGARSNMVRLDLTL